MDDLGRLSFRFTHSGFAEPKSLSSTYLGDYYILNCENYLKTLSYTVVRYTAGVHIDAKSPHLHIHFLVNTGDARIPRSFIQDWKYKFQTRKVLTHVPCIKHEGQDVKFPCLFSTLHKRKINVSIRYTPPPLNGESSVSLDADRFLAYPFKEGSVIAHYFRDILSPDDEENLVNRLKSQGQGEWNSAKIKMLKEQQKAERTSSEYGKICDILHDAKPDNYQDAVRIVLEEVKKSRTEYRDHIQPRFLIQSVQKYCFHSGIWTVDEIIEKFA